MNNVIAVPRAKRIAARRSFTRTIMLALLALCVGASFDQASAQSSDAGVWRHPDGLFSLRPPMAGAVALPAPDGDLAAFQIGSPTPIRLCSVRQSPISSAAALPQDALNQRMAGIASIMPRQSPNLAATDRRSFDRDGVTVYALRLESPAIIMHEWMFAVVGPSSAFLEKIDCGGAPPVTAADEAKFDAFLNTLHFPSERTHP